MHLLIDHRLKLKQVERAKADHPKKPSNKLTIPYLKTSNDCMTF